MRFSNELLPDPEGPVTATDPPGSMIIDISRNAQISPAPLGWTRPTPSSRIPCVGMSLETAVLREFRNMLFHLPAGGIGQNGLGPITDAGEPAHLGLRARHLGIDRLTLEPIADPTAYVPQRA